MIAVGMYLRTLREARGLSQNELAALAHTTGNTIWRIEAGKQEPKAAQLANIMAVLRAHADDIAALINESSASAEDGAALARKAYQAELTRMSDDDRRKLAERLMQLARDVAGAPPPQPQ